MEKHIRKVPNGQGDDYTTGCLLDYPYFKENYKIIAIDLNKQQTLDVDAKAIHQINFIGNLYRAGQAFMFFIYEQVKDTILDFSQGIVRVFKNSI